MRVGTPYSDREQRRPLPPFVPLPVPKGQDHLFGTEEVQDESHTRVERGVGRSLGSQQLGHPGGRTVAEGVRVQIGQRRDDELAGQVEGLAGKVRGDGLCDTRHSAVLDEEDAVPGGLVGGVEDGGAGEGEALGSGGPGAESWRQRGQGGREEGAPTDRHSRFCHGGGGWHMSRSSFSFSFFARSTPIHMNSVVSRGSLHSTTRSSCA